MPKNTAQRKRPTPKSRAAALAAKAKQPKELQLPDGVKDLVIECARLNTEEGADIPLVSVYREAVETYGYGRSRRVFGDTVHKLLKLSAWPRPNKDALG